MVRGLISERSYPWAVEPVRLNGSIRHRKAAAGRASEACIGVAKRSPRLIQADGGGSGDVKLWNDVKYFHSLAALLEAASRLTNPFVPEWLNLCSSLW